MAFSKKYFSFRYLQNLVVTGMIFFISVQVIAQFAPPAGQAGTTALHADSTAFIAWASSCNIVRGWVNIADTSLGKVSAGSGDFALDKADLSIVSLGDGGQATLGFAVPLINGPGYDFAVFENGFDDFFLELAFVEVSSDGEQFFRFPATSLTQTETQIETFDILEAQKLNNLAGKYRGGYSVPFDLEELAQIEDLNVNHIVAVRIVDVVGSIANEYANFDTEGNKVNDPWPTPFESGGFDLDAIGVIHNEESNDVTDLAHECRMLIYPNPFTSNLFMSAKYRIIKILVFNHVGCMVADINTDSEHIKLQTNSWVPGFYFLHITTKKGIEIHKLIKH